MFDIENLLDALNNYFKNNLNAEITAINTIKSSSLPLINQDAFIQSMEESNKSFDKFVLTQLTGVSTIMAGPVAAKSYELEIVMFIEDSYGVGTNWREVTRYWQAMERCASSAWDKVSRGMQADITGLAPIAIDVNQGSNSTKVFGVQINFTIS